MKNLFEYGGSQQMLIIKSYLDRMEDYHLDSGETLSNYYERNLRNIFAMMEEYEEMPDWVLDELDYVQKSEIMICVALLFKVSNMPEVNISMDKVKHIFRIRTQKELHDNLTALQKLSTENCVFNTYKEFMEINKKIQKICIDRDLDFLLVLTQVCYERKYVHPVISLEIENN